MLAAWTWCNLSLSLSLSFSYQTPSYVASIVGSQNLTLIAASYYQKVNSAVEVGAKAGYDVQAQKASGLELASKYKLDPLSFAKVRIIVADNVKSSE